MSQRHSMAYIKTDGQLLPTLPSPTVDLGGVERAPVVGNNSMLGHSEVFKPATLECEISLGLGMSLAQLQKIKDATVTYEADTGQTYVIREAFVTETLKVSGGADGKVTLKFAGQPAEEMVS